MYADAKRCLKPIDQLHVGDFVIIRQARNNKLTPAYRPEPMTATKVKGTWSCFLNKKDSQEGVSKRVLHLHDRVNHIWGNRPRDRG